MHSQALILFALAATTVFALPTEVVKRDWTSDYNGNIKIFFSDDTINIGDVNVGDIMSNMSTPCNPSGSCDNEPFTLKGIILSNQFDNEVAEIDVTVTPQGIYPSWLHDPLISSLKAAITAAATCKNVTIPEPCVDPMYPCPVGDISDIQCTVPSYWSIQYQAPNASSSAPPTIMANLSAKEPGTGFCSTFSTIGSAVAGAVNGAAGGAFSLLGLFCQS